MDRATLTLQQADGSIEYVETLLERNELPSQDVRTTPGQFYIGYAGTDPIGIGGIEQYGTTGLLRSVVIEHTVRENGYGTALCDALETRASEAGVETVYLLTTTAADFFTNRGYRHCERTAVPAAIRRTTEFDSLCPTTATCLRKSLSDRS